MHHHARRVLIRRAPSATHRRRGRLFIHVAIIVQRGRMLDEVPLDCVWQLAACIQFDTPHEPAGMRWGRDHGPSMPAYMHAPGVHGATTYEIRPIPLCVCAPESCLVEQAPPATPNSCMSVGCCLPDSSAEAKIPHSHNRFLKTLPTCCNIGG